MRQCLNDLSIYHVKRPNLKHIDENESFYQYLRNTRKRNIKWLRDNEELLKGVNAITQAKTDLQGYLKDILDELEWLKKEQCDEDFKNKLELLKEKGIIDDNYES